MQLTTSAGAGIQLQAYRYRLETEIQAQLHVNTIVLDWLILGLISRDQAGTAY